MGSMPLPRFTLRQLGAFVTVAETRSFALAADRLALTAQAVSQSVAELETVLGFRLFERTTRHVDLSAAGRELLGTAVSLLREAGAVDAAAADVRNRAAGLVRIGAPLVLASAVLPEAVRDHAAARPKVVVRIRDIPVDKLVDSVASGEVDMAVGPDRAVGAEVQREPLFESAWVLWCAPDHPLARRRSLNWSHLRSVPLVAAGRDHERSVAQMLVGLAADARITPVDVVDNISTALGIASQGLAATLAPAYVQVMARHFGLVQRRVVNPETVRTVCLYLPQQPSLSPAAQGFAEHLAKWLAHWHDRSKTSGKT